MPDTGSQQNVSDRGTSDRAPTDTTVRQLAREFRDATSRYRALFDANLLGVAVATAQGVEEANDEYLRLAGTTRERLLSGPFDWKAITPPEDLEKDLRGMQEMLARGACTPFEKAYVRPSGERVPMLVGAALIDREPMRWIAFALDLTARKAAEAERDRLLQEAHEARAAAERALAERDALLARVTHDLRTPLAANFGYTSLLHDGIPAPLPDVHAKIVERMMNNQRHMMRLVDGLLEFAGVNAAKHAVDVSIIPVSELLSAIEHMMAPQMNAAGMIFRNRPVPADLAVKADRTKATQILANLVGNAIKFTPSGGEITVSAARHSDLVRIAVSDTGVGIPPDQLERIFVPFVQGSSSPANLEAGGGRGVGLGLAISLELARLMGGDLTVQSEAGRGSIFTLSLPAA